MLFRTIAVLWVALGALSGAQAQTFPSKSMRLVLPFPAGGPTDLLGRAVEPALLGSTVIRWRAGRGRTRSGGDAPRT